MRQPRGAPDHALPRHFAGPLCRLAAYRPCRRIERAGRSSRCRRTPRSGSHRPWRPRRRGRPCGGASCRTRYPLGICPTSNLTLKVYPSIEAHPIDRLRKAGVRVSVNTDDPSLLATNLPAEYGLASAAFGWSDEIVRNVARTSIDASFANADVKARPEVRLATGNRSVGYVLALSRHSKRQLRCPVLRGKQTYSGHACDSRF